jgi:aquaporin Z
VLTHATLLDQLTLFGDHCAGVTQGNRPPFVIGSALMVVVYMGGSVSGAHYNPAVSLALFLRGKMLRRDLLPYMAAQLAGALVGAYLSFMFLDRATAPGPAPTATQATALLVEALYTCLLALVVLNCAARDATKGNSYFGLAIGFTILVAAYAGGSISGGAFNPAVGTGLRMVNAVVGDNSGSLDLSGRSVRRRCSGRRAVWAAGESCARSPRANLAGFARLCRRRLRKRWPARDRAASPGSSETQ